MVKPRGTKRGQRPQPDENIVWLLNRNGGEVVFLGFEGIVGMLAQANKPTNVGEVQKAINRLSKSKGQKVVTEELDKNKFKLILVNK